MLLSESVGCGSILRALMAAASRRTKWLRLMSSKVNLCCLESSFSKSSFKIRHAREPIARVLSSFSRCGEIAPTNRCTSCLMFSVLKKAVLHSSYCTLHLVNTDNACSFTATCAALSISMKHSLMPYWMMADSKFHSFSCSRSSAVLSVWLSVSTIAIPIFSWPSFRAEILTAIVADEFATPSPSKKRMSSNPCKFPGDAFFFNFHSFSSLT
mmetsp:Transcript_5661/g.8771  ORF Transcript_5661/g.8771 Transcript_5661/m.8771 type:complete len:212 (-) Transcript_5661:348-983(-)